MESSTAAPAVVRLDGPLTVSNADSIRAALLAGLNEASLVIDCSAATEVDLSFVQLLLAARRSAARRGKAVRLAAPASGALLDVLGRAGLLGPSGAAAADASFWIEGASA